MMSKLLPENILASAFQLHEDLAWKKESLAAVFDFCIQASIAVTSVEAWIVRKVKDCAPDEPTLHIHNLDPERNKYLNVLGRTRDHVIWGLFPLKNGQMTLMSWGSSDTIEKTWSSYVQKTVSAAREIIEKTNLEEEIVAKYAPFIYYNLIFELEDGTTF